MEGVVPLPPKAFTHKAVVHLKKLAYASADTIESLTREIEAALGKTDKNLFRTISSAPTFVSQWNQESYSKLIYPLLPLDQFSERAVSLVEECCSGLKSCPQMSTVFLATLVTNLKSEDKELAEKLIKETATEDVGEELLKRLPQAQVDVPVEGISSVKRFLEGVKTYPLMKDKFWESLLDELKPGDKEFVIASIPHEDVDVEVLSRSLLLESSNPEESILVSQFSSDAVARIKPFFEALSKFPTMKVAFWGNLLETLTQEGDKSLLLSLVKDINQITITDLEVLLQERFPTEIATSFSLEAVGPIRTFLDATTKYPKLKPHFMDLVLGELAGPDKNLFTSLVGGDIGTVDMSAMEKELLSRFPTAKIPTNFSDAAVPCITRFLVGIKSFPTMKTAFLDTLLGELNEDDKMLAASLCGGDIKSTTTQVIESEFTSRFTVKEVPKEFTPDALPHAQELLSAIKDYPGMKGAFWTNFLEALRGGDKILATSLVQDINQVDVAELEHQITSGIPVEIPNEFTLDARDHIVAFFGGIKQFPQMKVQFLETLLSELKDGNKILAKSLVGSNISDIDLSILEQEFQKRLPIAELPEEFSLESVPVIKEFLFGVQSHPKLCTAFRGALLEGLKGGDKALASSLLPEEFNSDTIIVLVKSFLEKVPPGMLSEFQSGTTVTTTTTPLGTSQILTTSVEFVPHSFSDVAIPKLKGLINQVKNKVTSYKSFYTSFTKDLPESDAKLLEETIPDIDQVTAEDLVSVLSTFLPVEEKKFFTNTSLPLISNFLDKIKKKPSSFNKELQGLLKHLANGPDAKLLLSLTEGEKVDSNTMATYRRAILGHFPPSHITGKIFSQAGAALVREFCTRLENDKSSGTIFLASLLESLSKKSSFAADFSLTEKLFAYVDFEMDDFASIHQLIEEHLPAEVAGFQEFALGIRQICKDVSGLAEKVDKAVGILWDNSFDLTDLELSPNRLAYLTKLLASSDFVTSFFKSRMMKYAQQFCSDVKLSSIPNLPETVTTCVIQGSLDFGVETPEHESKFDKLKKLLLKNDVSKMLLSGIFATRGNNSPLLQEFSKICSGLGILPVAQHSKLLGTMIKGDKVKLPDYYSSKVARKAKETFKPKNFFDELRRKALMTVLEDPNFDIQGQNKRKSVADDLFKGIFTLNNALIRGERVKQLSAELKSDDRVQQILSGLNFQDEDVILAWVTKICWDHNAITDSTKILFFVKRGLFTLNGFRSLHERKAICASIESAEPLQPVLERLQVANEDRLLYKVTKLCWEKNVDEKHIPAIIEAVSIGLFTLNTVPIPLQTRKEFCECLDDDAFIHSIVTTPSSSESEILYYVTRHCWKLNVDESLCESIVLQIKRGLYSLNDVPLTFDVKRKLDDALRCDKKLTPLLQTFVPCLKDQILYHISQMCWKHNFGEDVAIKEIYGLWSKGQMTIPDTLVTTFKIPQDLIEALTQDEALKTLIHGLQEESVSRLKQSITDILAKNHKMSEASPQAVADALLKGMSLSTVCTAEVRKLIEEDNFIRKMVVEFGGVPPQKSVTEIAPVKEKLLKTGTPLHVFLFMARTTDVKPTFWYPPPYNTTYIPFVPSTIFPDIWVVRVFIPEETWHGRTSAKFELMLQIGTHFSPERPRELYREDSCLFLVWDPPLVWTEWFTSVLGPQVVPHSSTLFVDFCIQTIHSLVNENFDEADVQYDLIWVALHSLRSRFRESVNGILAQYFKTYLAFTQPSGNMNRFWLLVALLSGSGEIASFERPRLEVLLDLIEKWKPSPTHMLSALNSFDIDYSCKRRCLSSDIKIVLQRLFDPGNEGVKGHKLVFPFLIYNLPVYAKYLVIKLQNFRDMYKNFRINAVFVSPHFDIDFGHFFAGFQSLLGPEFWKLFMVLFSIETLVEKDRSSLWNKLEGHLLEALKSCDASSKLAINVFSGIGYETCPGGTLFDLLSLFEKAEEARAPLPSLLNDQLVPILAELGDRFPAKDLTELCKVWLKLSPHFQKKSDWVKDYLNSFDTRHKIFTVMESGMFIQQATELQWEGAFYHSKVGIRVREQLCNKHIPKCLNSQVDFLLEHNKSTADALQKIHHFLAELKHSPTAKKELSENLLNCLSQADRNLVSSLFTADITSLERNLLSRFPRKKLPLQLQLDGWKAFFADLTSKGSPLVKSAEEALTRWFETIGEEDYAKLDKAEFTQMEAIATKLDTIKEHLRTRDCTIEELKKDLRDRSFKAMLQHFFRWDEAEALVVELESYIRNLSAFQIAYLPHINLEEGLPAIHTELVSYRSLYVSHLVEQTKLISTENLATFTKLAESKIFRKIWNSLINKKVTAYSKQELEDLVSQSAEKWNELLSSIADGQVTFGTLDDIFQSTEHIQDEVKFFQFSFAGQNPFDIHQNVFSSFLVLRTCQKYMAPLVMMLKFFKLDVLDSKVMSQLEAEVNGVTRNWKSVKLGQLKQGEALTRLVDTMGLPALQFIEDVMRTNNGSYSNELIEWLQGNENEKDFADLMRDVTLKDPHQLAAVANHCSSLRHRMKDYLYSNIVDTWEFLATLQRSEATFRQEHPQSTYKDEIRTVLNFLPDIKAGVENMRVTPSEKARKAVRQILGLKEGTSAIIFNTQGVGVQLGVKYYSDEGASEIYLAELLDLYNDLMDIDPNQAKDSESLGEAQKNTNFFRDMLILMQETFHQVELIQQWGFLVKFRESIDITEEICGTLTTHKEELQEVLDAWKELINTVWHDPERKCLTVFTVRQLLTLVAACLPENSVPCPIDRSKAASIVELHFPDSGFKKKAQGLERSLLNNFKNKDLTLKGILEKTDFILAELSKFLQEYTANAVLMKSTLTATNDPLPDSVEAFMSKLKRSTANPQIRSKHFLIPVNSEKDSLTLLTMLNLSYSDAPLPFNNVFSCSSNTTLIDLQWFLRRWRYEDPSSPTLYCMVNIHELSKQLQGELVSRLKEEAPSCPLIMICLSDNKDLKHAFHSHTLVDLEMGSLEDICALCKRVRHHRQFQVVYSKYAGYGKSFYIQNQVAQDPAHSDAIYVCMPIQQATGYDLVNRLNGIAQQHKGKTVVHFDIGYILDSDTNYTLWSLIMFGKIVDESSTNVFQLPHTVHFIFEVPSKIETVDDPLHHFYALRLVDGHEVEMKPFSLETMSFVIPPESGATMPDRQRNISLYTVCTFLKYLKEGRIPEYITDQMWLPDKQVLDTPKEELFDSMAWALQSVETANPTWILFHGLIDFMRPHIDAFVQWPFWYNYAVAHAPNEWPTVFARIFKDTSIMTVNRNLDWTTGGDTEKSLIKWEDRQNVTLLMLFDYKQRYEDGVLVARPTSFRGVNFLARQNLCDLISNNAVKAWLKQQDVVIDRQVLQQAGSEMADIRKCVEHLFALTPANDKDVIDARATDIEEGLKDGSINYVLTPDNFLKMVFIQYRLKYRLPVIMMAETGIGKTALINFMVEKMLGCKLHQLDVHAGTTHADIIQFMSTPLREFKRGTQVYIFFDEFNTTKDPAAMCLFKEILCDRRIEGKPIHDGFCIIGAVNPYRVKFIRSRTEHGLSSYAADLNQTREEQVYRVQPLPNSVHEHIFNFGSLDIDTERLYISQMCHQYVRQMDSQLAAVSATDLDKLKKDLTSLVLRSHTFLRLDGNSADPLSAVSLRDVKRYFQLFKWFLQIKLENRSLPLAESIRRSIILSLFITYNCRFDADRRMAYWNHILQSSNCSSTFASGITEAEIQNLIETTQRNLAKEFILTEGEEDKETRVALNESFVENLFVAFVCVLNKIALYIVGKPGTSKSLAITILMNNLEATTENQKRLEKWNIGGIRYFFYQCSEQSTEEAVQQAFDKAKLFDRSSEVGQARVIAVLVLDEIGLAPSLKVIHSELESMDKDEDGTVGFIGLSNWSLDAAQMNRGILLQRTDPSLKDLVFTAQQIIGDNTFIAPVLERMAQGYHKLCEVAYEVNKKPYYGLRDFYSIIKGIDPDTFHMQKIWEGIYKNFAGFRKIKEEKLRGVFEEKGFKAPQNVPSDEYLIEQNLRNQTGTARHLMLLTKNLVALPLIIQKLKSLNLTHQVIFGTKFKRDLDYFTISKNLRKIATAMLYGTIIILIDAKSLYSPLYDVLNQHYKKRHGQNISRVAFGAETHEFIVHPSFRIIVIEDEDVVYAQYPPPLINRFEKRLVSARDHIAGLEPFTSLEQFLHNTFEPTKLPCYHSDLIPSLVIKVVANLESEEWREEDYEAARNLAKSLYLKVAKPQELYNKRRADEDLFQEYTSSYLKNTLHELLDEIYTQGVKRSICITTSTKFFSDSLEENVCIIPLFLIEKEAQLKDKIHATLLEYAEDPNCCVIVQHDSQTTTNMLFYNSKNLIEELLQETNFQGHFMFLVHVPSERDSKFSYSFEPGWSAYFVETLFPYGLMTTKYYLTSSAQVLINDIFTKAQEGSTFIDNFFRQKLGSILSEITTSPCYKENISKMIADYSTVLHLPEIRDYLLSYFLHVSEEEDVLAPSKGRKTDTDQPLYKCLNENVINNLCTWTTRVINHLDTNDNFTLLLREEAVPSSALKTLFVHILERFRMPSKHIVHNGTAFTAQFPFSFYLIEIFQLNLDHEYFNTWKETPVGQIFESLGIECTHLLFEAYIRDVMQTFLTNEQFRLLDKYLLSFYDFLSSLNTESELRTFLDVHQLVDNKLGLIQSTLQVLETIDTVSSINIKMTGKGKINEEKVEGLTCNWVIKEFVRQCKLLRAHFDDPKIRAKFVSLMLTKAPHVEILLAELEKEQLYTAQQHTQDWYPLLIQQQLVHLLNYFQDRLKAQVLTFEGLPAIVSQVTPKDFQMKEPNLTVTVIEELWKIVQRDILEGSYACNRTKQLIIGQPEGTVWECPFPSVTNPYLISKEEELIHIHQCPACNRPVGEGLLEHFKKIPVSAQDLKAKERKLRKDLNIIWYFVQELILTLLKQFSKHPPEFSSHLHTFLNFILTTKIFQPYSDYVSFGESNFIPILSYALNTRPEVEEVLDKILQSEVHPMFSFACLQVIHMKGLAAKDIFTFPKMEMRNDTPVLCWQQIRELVCYRENLLSNPNVLEEELSEDAVFFAVDRKVKECHWQSLVQVLTQDAKLSKLRKVPIVADYIAISSEFAFPFTFQVQLAHRSLLNAYQSQLFGNANHQPMNDTEYLRILSTDALGVIGKDQVEDTEIQYFALNRVIYHTIDFAHQTGLAPFYNLLDMFTANSPQAKVLSECFLPGNVPENELFINHPLHIALCPNDHPYFVGMAGSGNSCPYPTGTGTCELADCKQTTGGTGHVFAPGNKHLSEYAKDPNIAARPDIRLLLDKIHPKGWSIPVSPYSVPQLDASTSGQSCGSCRPLVVARTCLPLPLRILHIMMFSIAVAGVSKSEEYWTNLQTVHLCDVVSKADCPFCSKSKEEAAKLLSRHLEMSVKVLAINLNISKPAAIEFYHFILDLLHKECLGDYGSSEPIQNVQLFKDEPRRASLETKLAVLSSKQQEIKQEITRLRSSVSQKVPELEQKVMRWETAHHWIWYPLRDFSQEQFIAIFSSQHPAQMEKFPLIQFWIKSQKELQGLAYFPQTIQWLYWLMETYNHAITEDEAGIITIRDTITKLSADGKKNVPEVFHKFRKTWNAVWPHLGNLLGCARAAASITDFELMEEVSIKCCLPGELNENRLCKTMVDAAFSLHNSWLDELKIGPDAEDDMISVHLPSSDLAKGNSFLISIHKEEVLNFINEHYIFSEDLFPVLETFLKSRMIAGKQRMKYSLDMFEQKGAMMALQLIPSFEDKNAAFLEKLSTDHEEQLLEQLTNHHEDALQIIEIVIRWLSKSKGNRSSSSIQFQTLADNTLSAVVKLLHMFNKELEGLFRSSPTLENLEMKYIISAWRAIHKHTTSIPAEFSVKLTQEEKDKLHQAIPHLAQHLPAILTSWKQFNTNDLLSTENPQGDLQAFVRFGIKEASPEAAKAFKSHLPEGLLLEKSLAAWEFVSTMSSSQ